MKLRESRPAQILGAFAFCGHDVAKAGTDSANLAVRKSHRLVDKNSIADKQKTYCGNHEIRLPSPPGSSSNVPAAL
jgi:hypothetical protein